MESKSFLIEVTMKNACESPLIAELLVDVPDERLQGLANLEGEQRATEETNILSSIAGQVMDRHYMTPGAEYSFRPRYGLLGKPQWISRYKRPIPADGGSVGWILKETSEAKMSLWLQQHRMN